MQFNFPWFSLIYLAGAVLTLVLAIVIWKRQFAPGIIPFTFLLLSMTLWTLTSALEAGAVEIPAKVLFAKGEYLALVGSGALSLMFILGYSHSHWITRRRNVILLWVIPLLSLALVWTNELHGLVWANIYLKAATNWTYSIWEHGPLYWVVPLYQYILYFSGIIILFRYGLSRPRIYRRQVNWLLAGSLIPVIGSIIYITGGSPIEGFDLTPVSICIMGVVFAVTIFHFRLMDTLPAATTAFVKNLSDGFLLLDSEGHIVSLNPAAGRIMGQTDAFLIGQKLSQIWPDLDQVAGDDRSERHFELMRDKSGVKSYLDISFESFTDRYGTLTGKLVIIRDVTELKLTRLELEAEINKRSQFTRAVVHELRNPLTAIISSGNELKENEKVDEKIRIALVKNICRASTDLEQRVDELFELARGELGILEINPRLMDMNRLIEEICAEMGPVAAAKGLKLTRQASEPPAQVRGDEKRLRQVLSNLMGNSIKYTKGGQISIKSLHYGNNLLLTQIEDSGRGIEKEVLDNLFDPYLRSSREKSKSSGLGIGLALCKQYVELHKGKIWAESTPGKGTIISFTIPLYPSGKDSLQSTVTD
jgi:PAS domain S-box-containing protein